MFAGHKFENNPEVPLEKCEAFIIFEKNQEIKTKFHIFGNLIYEKILNFKESTIE